MKKKIICTILFAAILVGLYHFTTVLLYEKQHFGTAKNIAYEEPGQIDVFFVGASHIFYGINPSVIWDEAGISGYNLTTHQQPLWASKLLLQHALKNQRPKLIVLDVIMATNFARPVLKTEQGTNMTHLALDPVPLSLEKIKGVMDTDMITDKGEILFPIMMSHSRLQQGALTWEDFHFFTGDRTHPMKGYNFTTNILPYERPEQVWDSTHELPPDLEEVLRDFIAYCRDNNLPLLLIKTPMVERQETYKQLNYIAGIADEYGVPFIDFNHLYDELGLDFSADFADSGHLNVNGARKVSLYLADYLTERYDLADHRGDDAYASWKQASAHYHALTELPESDSLVPHLAASSDPNLLTMVLMGGTLPEEERVSLPDDLRAAFSDAGLSVPASVGEGAYYAVIQGGKVLYESSSSRRQIGTEFPVKDELFRVQVNPSAPDGGTLLTAAYLGEDGYGSFESGILLLTYDTDRMALVDVVKYENGQIDRNM